MILSKVATGGTPDQERAGRHRWRRHRLDQVQALGEVGLCLIPSQWLDLGKDLPPDLQGSSFTRTSCVPFEPLAGWPAAGPRAAGIRRIDLRVLT